MVQNLEVTKAFDQKERSRGAGLSDWKRVALEFGETSLVQFLEAYDIEELADGRNSHSVIHDRLEGLGLPTQRCLFASVGNFIASPDRFLDSIDGGDYYFVSIKPGTHLAHEASRQKVIDFVRSYAVLSDESELIREVFISNNGDPVMSGHIIVKDDGAPNTLLSEFTIGNFNDFHRGFTTPEISRNKSFRSRDWQFRGSLDASDGDWRNTKEFECFGGIRLNRVEMAERIESTIGYIPHDGDFYLPGYYEVLLEKVSDDSKSLRPVFIDVVIDEP